MHEKSNKSNAGYVKIHRSTFDNPLFLKFPEFIGPWVWMIAEARFKANGIGRGQLRLSKRELHRKFPYLSVSKCERFLGHISGHKMVEIEPQNGTQLSLITVCNYEKYQHMEETTEPQSEPQDMKIEPQSEPSYKKVKEGSKNVSKKRARGTRLPDDWQLSEDFENWVLVNIPGFPAKRIQTEATKFANYWQSKAGQSATKIDWMKTWQNWMLSANDRLPSQKPAQSKTSSILEKRIQRERLANG